MFLIDTNILSEQIRPRPAPGVEAWYRAQTRIEVSAISLIEIEYGVARLPSGARRDRLVKWFENVWASPAVTIVAVDETVARAAGRLRASTESVGRPRPFADLIIAATAQVTGAVLASRNVADFDGLGIPLVNPFNVPH